MVKTLLNVKWLISMRFSWYFIYDVTYLSNDVTFRNALWSKMTKLGRKLTLKMEFLTVYFMKIIFQVFLLWIEHKVYIVNLSLRASDDVIMPFWSERVIVLTLLCLEVRGGTVRRLKEREKKENRSLPVYPRENTNKYYDSGTVKCVRLTLVVTPG